MKDLPDELVIEILRGLPHYNFVANNMMKKLQQPWTFLYFKFMMKDLVSRCRLSFDLADRKDGSTLKLISQYPEFQRCEFSLEFLPCYRGEDAREPITILKTFNDLILCCAENFDQSECVYYICNPLTKQWVALPPTPPTKFSSFDVEFICEPHYCTDENHQGTVILNTQFKFKVRCLNVYDSEIVRLQIFSSDTGQWNMTRISVPRSPQKSFIARSFVCKEKLILIMVDRWDANVTLSSIKFDDYLSKSIQRVTFPGSQFFRSPYYSIVHLSSPLGRVHMVQICINYVANHGLPLLLIWELTDRWKLRQKVPFRDITSEDRWISDIYLKKGHFVVEENGKLLFHIPIVLGFHLHPYKGYLLYLNLNRDNRMAFYDIKNKTLNLVSKTWCPSSFPEYGFHHFMWSAVSEFELPLWPTPVPQISKEPLASKHRGIEGSPS
ncbi:hypothetical protein L6164_022863 [Bauhinia variegata]|uniref:Uncharacterized protein n=1 Tax=Bauhinia variegata TaxID=167791 RepID=A0ACB9MGS3_BAUVA|nr:hypothetical protein L6164_022863 [Bauhinia variegata]